VARGIECDLCGERVREVCIRCGGCDDCCDCEALDVEGIFDPEELGLDPEQFDLPLQERRIRDA